MLKLDNNNKISLSQAMVEMIITLTFSTEKIWSRTVEPKPKRKPTYKRRPRSERIVDFAPRLNATSSKGGSSPWQDSVEILFYSLSITRSHGRALSVDRICLWPVSHFERTALYCTQSHRWYIVHEHWVRTCRSNPSHGVAYDTTDASQRAGQEIA